MKRFIFLFILLTAALPVSAQYMPAEGLITRKGTKIFAEGRKLTKGEIAATLSMVQDDSGAGYDVRWTKARRGYNAGIALTSIGSVFCFTGGIAFSCGMMVLVASGMTFPLYAVSGDNDGLDEVMQNASLVMAAGGIAALAGTAFLGAGIPLLCVNKARMKRIVRDYNGLYSGNQASALTLNFGPTASGVGLALNF